MSMFAYVITGLLVLLLVLGLTAAAISLYVTWKLTHPVRKPVDMDPKDFGLDRWEEVRFPSREAGISLSGWYIAAAENGCEPRRRTLVFAHGYSQNRLEPHLPALSLAARLVRAGYDVLMFDFRNAGKSDDALTTIGLREQEDLHGAIDHVQALRPDHAIGLIGFSMGAVTSLLAGCRDERVGAIVADSPFYSLPEYLKDNLPRWTGLPAFPFNRLILMLTPFLLGAGPGEVKPYLAVQQADKPILFIHGTRDETIPCEESKRLHALAKHPGSLLWLVPGATHVGSYARRPQEYASQVIRFFEQGLEG